MGTLTTELVRGLTVEILHKTTKEVKGTGIVATPDGIIITCTHVLEEALGPLGPEKLPSLPELVVRFPEINNLTSDERKATVLAYLDSHLDDIALLKLDEKDGPSPIGPEKLVSLDIAENSLGLDFISYGYVSLSDENEEFYYRGFGIGGKVFSIVSNKKTNMFCRKVQLNAENIVGGLSGAPVVVQNKNGHYIVGIISEAVTKGFKNMGLAVDAKIFFIPDSPFREHLKFRRSKPNSLIDPLPKTNKSLASETTSFNPDMEWKDLAPKIPDYWVERVGLMSLLADSWKNETKRLVNLVGQYGMGKTTLARKWIEDLLTDPRQELPKPKKTFWWSFSEKPSVETFFESALNYMSGEVIDQSQFKSINNKMNSLAKLVAEMEEQDRCLFILDDLDEFQHSNGLEMGRISNEELRVFISHLARSGHCLAISRIPLSDYINQPCYIQHDVIGLSKDESREILGKLGAKLPEKELDKIILAFNGVPLMLTLSANTHKKDDR